MNTDYFTMDDGQQYRIEDGDSIYSIEGIGKRIQGLDTNEVFHPDHIDSAYLATHYGDAQTEVLRKLILERGFTGINHTGEQDDRNDKGAKRDLVDIYNPETLQTTADVMYYQGLVGLKGGPGPFAAQNISPKHYQLYRQGQLARARGESNPFYDELREDLQEARQKDVHFLKGIAPTEQFFDSRFDRDVYLRHSDRDIYNHANSVFKSSISGGIDSMQSGFYGIIEMVGNRTGWNHLEHLGKSGVEYNKYQIGDLPTWVSDVHDVESVGDFAEWAIGALGGSMPFFALMAAGFLPIPGAAQLSWGSMALAYTGMTINDMEGDISKKSFKKALMAGIAMASFERLGGMGMFGRSFNLKRLGTKDGVEEMKRIYMDKNKMTRKQVDAIFAENGKEGLIGIMSDIKRNDVIWKLYAKSVAKRGLVGTTSEAITEAAQEATQYSTAYWGSEAGEGKFDKEEFRKIIENSAAAGGLLGGVIGVGGAALGESSPISLNIRQRKWERTKNTKYNVEDPLDMATIINESSQRYIQRDFLGMDQRGAAIAALNDVIRDPKTTEENRTKAKEALDAFIREPARADSRNKVKDALKIAQETGLSFQTSLNVDSNVQENDVKVKKMLEERKTEQKAKSFRSRVGEVILDNEGFSSGYNVLKRRMKDAWKLSNTLAAEFSFSGFIHDRMHAGQTHVQNRRTFEGRQHTPLRSIMQELRRSLGIRGDRRSNRAKAYVALRDYILKEQEMKRTGLENDPTEWSKWFKEQGYDIKNQIAFRKAKQRIIKEYEVEQRHIYKLANPKYMGNIELHTFLNKKISATKVEKQREKFITALQTKGYSAKEAELEADAIENTPESYEYNEYANTDFLTKKPISLKKTNRYNANDIVFQDFWEDNTYDQQVLRATQIAHYVSDTIATGFGGDRLNSRILAIQQELVDNMGQEYADKWMPEIATTIYNHYLAHRGELNRIQNKNLKMLASNAGAMMALAYMPMAVFSSIPEIGLVFLGADKAMAIKVAKTMAKQTGSAMIDMMKKISDGDLTESERHFAMEVMRKRGMLTHEYGAGHVIDADVDGNRKNWLQRKVMPGFYLITGLTGFTTAMRLFRGSVANDFIAVQMDILTKALHSNTDENGNPREPRNPETFRDFTNREARAFAKLKELGGNPREIVNEFRELERAFEAIKPETKFANFADWLMLSEHVYGDGLSSAAIDLSRKIDVMRSNFVDAALVNPDPGKRPLFYSDDRFRLLVLFQGYLSIFSSQIIAPILKNLVGKGSPQDQVNSAAIMLSTVALGFLGQAIKDEIKYGDRPSWLTDAEYWQRGIQASGLMGQYERPWNLFFPLYGSEEDSIVDRAWGEVGPLSSTIDSAMKSMAWAMEGEGERALNKLFKISPGIGVFTSGRQKLAETLANAGD